MMFQMNVSKLVSIITCGAWSAENPTMAAACYLLTVIFLMSVSVYWMPLLRVLR